MSREKGRAREREKYESELGTALRVSERDIILELAEVLREELEGEQKKDSEGTRVDDADTDRHMPVGLSYMRDKQASVRRKGASKPATGAIKKGELIRYKESTRMADANCLEAGRKTSCKECLNAVSP
jgi:hypothetical protein